jgi:hypothetical protein
MRDLLRTGVPTSYRRVRREVKTAGAAFRDDRLDASQLEALFCLRKLPENHEANFLMALILYRRGDYDRALEQVRTAEGSYVRLAVALALAGGRQNLQGRMDRVLQASDGMEELGAAYAPSKGHAGPARDGSAVPPGLRMEPDQLHGRAIIDDHGHPDPGGPDEMLSEPPG